MALYYEAAAMLQASSDSSSLSARVYAAQDLKSKPAQLFALLSEAAVWSPVLSPVIEVAEVLKHERKVSESRSLQISIALADIHGSLSPSSHLFWPFCSPMTS